MQQRKNLATLKKTFEREGKKGVINTYLQIVGGPEGLRREFGSVDNFCKYMKVVGFSRAYIYKVKKELKD